MVAPPGTGHSLEDRNDFCNGLRRQESRLKTWFGCAIGALEGNVAGDIRLEFNEATAAVPRRRDELQESESPAEKRMSRICDGDFVSGEALVYRGSIVVEVCHCRLGRTGPS